MNYNSLKATINASIKQNGNQEITGVVLNSVLNAMVNALASAGATFGGVIDPTSPAPVSLDQATIYLALTPGEYTNFLDEDSEPIVVDGIALIQYDGGGTLEFSKTELKPWQMTIVPDVGNDYIGIFVPNGGCTLAVDSVGFHGMICITNAYGISSATFVGSGGINTSVNVESGRMNTTPIVVLKSNNNATITITCVAGNAPDGATATDEIIITPIATKAWTELGAGGGGGSNGAVRYDESQSLTDAQKLQARTNIGAAKEKETLILDQTFTLERLQPIAYDSGTKYYEVSSMPSWVAAGDGETFYAVLNVIKFSAANSVPYAAGNAYSEYQLTKIDSTHFALDPLDEPGGTPDVAAFYFTPINQRVAIPMPSAVTKYRMIIENASAISSKYESLGFMRSDGYNYGGASPMGAEAFGYYTPRALQVTQDLVFSINPSTFEVTAISLEQNALVKSNATSFNYICFPKVYGDKVSSIWGTGTTTLYIGTARGAMQVIKDGTRVRIYKIND